MCLCATQFAKATWSEHHRSEEWLHLFALCLAQWPQVSDRIVKGIRYKREFHLIGPNLNRDIVHLLLEHGANPNIVDHNGSSPLHLASWTGDYEVVNMLIANANQKADINLKVIGIFIDQLNHANGCHFAPEQR